MSIVETLPNWFAKTRAGREAAAEEAERLESERLEHAQKLAAIESENEKTVTPLWAAEAKTWDKLKTLRIKRTNAVGLDQFQRAEWEIKIRSAEIAHGKAEQARRACNAAAEPAKQTHKDFLAANPPTAIASFDSHLGQLIAETSDPSFRTGVNEPAGLNLNTMKQTITTRDNSAARRSRLAGLRALRADNRDRFWLEPWTVEKLEAEQAKRLAEICDGKELS